MIKIFSIYNKVYCRNIIVSHKSTKILYSVYIYANSNFLSLLYKDTCIWIRKNSFIFKYLTTMSLDFCRELFKLNEMMTCLFAWLHRNKYTEVCWEEWHNCYLNYIAVMLIFLAYKSYTIYFELKTVIMKNELYIKSFTFFSFFSSTYFLFHIAPLTTKNIVTFALNYWITKWLMRLIN